MDLLEIRLNVGSFLTRPDLACCLRVSKLWYTSYLPLIYAVADSHSLDNHWFQFRYVKDLRMYSDCFSKKYYTESLLQMQSLCRLHLEFSQPWRKLSYSSEIDPDEVLLRMLKGQTNPGRLKEVALNSYSRGLLPPPAGVIEFLVKFCPSLTILDFRHVALSKEEETLYQVLYQLGPRLQQLTLHQCWPIGISRERATDESSFIWNPQQLETSPPVFNSLKSLKIEYRTVVNYTLQEQLRLFRSCPNLESLDWSIIEGARSSASDFLQELCDTVLQSSPLISSLPNVLCCPWPRLDSLALFSDEYLSPVSDALMTRFLNHFPNPIRKLSLPQRTAFETLGWQALKERHFESLEILRLLSATSSMIQQILSSCPNLLEFYGSALNIDDVVEDWGRGIVKTAENELRPSHQKTQSSSVFKKFQKIIKKKKETPTPLSPSPPPPPPPKALFSTPPKLDRPWVCHRLQVLSIEFHRIPFQVWDEDPTANLKIFEQLVQLRYLRTIHLVSRYDAHRIGLNPGKCLEMLEDVYDTIGTGNTIFPGTHYDQSSIRKSLVGRRLLKIWPGPFIKAMDILEIRLNVGSFLTKQELIVCIRLSRIWYETFIGLLHRYADASVIDENWSLFRPVLHHIREFRINFLRFRCCSSTQAQQFLPQLRLLTRLHFEFARLGLLSENQELVMKLLQQNSTRLQQLCLQGEARTEALPTPPGLFDLLVQSCSSSLTVLEVRNVSLGRDDFENSRVLKLIFYQLGTRLRRLVLLRC
ncbi:hypothetical protein BGZ83_008467 [Gryganskiella cystojenkinii]|nr:hypothetical protein BGZ83_008467 [Gryganskiella cystojenkinii]